MNYQPVQSDMPVLLNPTHMGHLSDIYATATDMKQDINRTFKRRLKGHERGIRGQTPHIRLKGLLDSSAMGTFGEKYRIVQDRLFESQLYMNPNSLPNQETA